MAGFALRAGPALALLAGPALAQVVAPPGHAGPPARFDGSVQVNGYDGFVSGAATLGGTGLPVSASVSDSHADSAGLPGRAQAFGRAGASARTRVSATEIGTAFTLDAQARSDAGYPAFYAPGVTASAQASLTLPLQLQAAALAPGAAGVLRLRFTSTGQLSSFASGSIGNGAPGYGSGYSAAYLDVSGQVIGRDGSCTSGWDFCAYRPVNAGDAASGLAIPAVFDVDLAVNAGSWTQVSMTLLTRGSATANARAGAGLPGQAEAAFSAAFFNSVVLAGVVGVFDARGIPVAGWTLQSLPGVSIAAVPEPASAGLLLLGGCALWWRRRIAGTPASRAA